jgi:hypothetical protein
MNAFRLLVVTTSLALGLGCDAQPDGDYKGEPLATLTGTISVVGEVPSGLEMALVWVVEGARYTWSTVPVSGTFPALFTIELFTPPPEEFMQVVLSNPEAPSAAFAFPGMVRAGESPDDPNAIFALSPDYSVIYAEEEYAFDSPAWVGSLAVGYNLIRTIPTQREFNQCVSDRVATGETEMEALDACSEHLRSEVVDLSTPIFFEIFLLE